MPENFKGLSRTRSSLGFLMEGGFLSDERSTSDFANSGARDSLELCFARGNSAWNEYRTLSVKWIAFRVDILFTIHNLVIRHLLHS